MNDELQTFQENLTWDIVLFPPNVKPIGCKWVYRVKLNLNGSLNHYKSRSIVLGNKYKYRIDHDETSRLVSQMKTIRTSFL